jgi:hypothetical protein
MKAHRFPWRWHHLHPAKLILFALLSVADLFMTWQLVQASGGKVYESNPVANAWLVSFGWTGLTVFKALSMVMVAAAAIYVSLYRPRIGGGILIFACAATAYVVGYSCYLGLHPEPLHSVTSDESFDAEQKGRMLDREMKRQKQYQTLLTQLSGDLLGGRISLQDAVARLGQSDKARSAQWLAVLHRTYPGRSDAECLAIHLISHALSTLPQESSIRQRLASQLETEYQTIYGSEVILDLTVQASGNRPTNSVSPGSEIPPFLVFSSRIDRP